MESILCTRIESINKNTKQLPSATFLIHFSYAYGIHHSLHCNSAAKAHTKETLGSEISRLACNKASEESKYILSMHLQTANMILAELLCPLCEYFLPEYLKDN